MKYSRLVLGSGVIAELIIAVFILPKRKAPPQRLLNVAVDTNGVTHVGGVPLASTNIRDGVFRVMRAVGLRAGFVEAGVYSNEPQRSNSLETLTSMTRAGLLPISTNSPPNPFE